MSKLVFDAIGKYIHPTRYRQIVETQSLNHLTSEEQRILSEDQQHSSAVAKLHYQKQRSREVTLKGHECLQKLQDAKGSEVDEDATQDSETRLPTPGLQLKECKISALPQERTPCLKESCALRGTIAMF